MEPDLKYLHSPDIDDLELFKPQDTERFAFLLQIMVGVRGEDGEESFDVQVCTLKWLEDKYAEDDVIIARHMLIVQKYNYQGLLTTIHKFLQHCHGDTWRDVALKISRLGQWEFEDYED